jgi:hypothetical protein
MTMADAMRAQAKGMHVDPTEVAWMAFPRVGVIHGYEDGCEHNVLMKTMYF